MARKKKAPNRPRSTKKTSWQPSWIQGRALMVSEALLAIGLMQEAMESAILGLQHVDPILRVLAAVAVSMGTLGGLMLWLRRKFQNSLKGTHDAIQRRLYIPSLLIHVLFVTGLLLGYAALWNEDTGALDLMFRYIRSWFP